MNYRVEWTETAEQELANIWLNSQDRAFINYITRTIEKWLKIHPLQIGESRTSSIHRVIAVPPIMIEYEVVEDDKLVIVHAVWSR